MQARELTAAEVEEGKRGIKDQTFSATQVQALVRTMDLSKKRHRSLKLQGRTLDYELALKKENETLYFNYPSLFQMHAEDKLDETFFGMLNLKRRIERGELTADQASAMVGQELFNRFVPHVISNTGEAPAPRMSYEDFYKQSTP